ncbi:hypothetical protein GCM10028818_32200 [Spirosoma horti]
MVVVVVTSVGVLLVEYVVFGVVELFVFIEFDDMLLVEFVLSVVTGDVYEEFVVAPVVE